MRNACTGVCVCFPAHTSSMGHGSGVCVQQHVHMQILCMEHHLGLWVFRSSSVKPKQRRTALWFFFLSQKVPSSAFTQLGFAGPSAAFGSFLACLAWGVPEIRSSATKSSDGVLMLLLVICCSQVPTTSVLKQRLVQKAAAQHLAVSFSINN